MDLLTLLSQPHGLVFHEHRLGLSGLGYGKITGWVESHPWLLPSLAASWLHGLNTFSSATSLCHPIPLTVLTSFTHTRLIINKVLAALRPAAFQCLQSATVQCLKRPNSFFYPFLSFFLCFFLTGSKTLKFGLNFTSMIRLWIVSLLKALCFLLSKDFIK